MEERACRRRVGSAGPGGLCEPAVSSTVTHSSDFRRQVLLEIHIFFIGYMYISKFRISHLLHYLCNKITSCFNTAEASLLAQIVEALNSRIGRDASCNFETSLCLLLPVCSVSPLMELEFSTWQETALQVRGCDPWAPSEPACREWESFMRTYFVFCYLPIFSDR